MAHLNLAKEVRDCAVWLLRYAHCVCHQHVQNMIISKLFSAIGQRDDIERLKSETQPKRETER